MPPTPGILKSQQIFGSRDYAWNQGMVPASGGPTRAFGLRGSRSRASFKGSRVPTPFKCATLHDAFMANREQQIFIFSQLLPSISKLLTDPGQVDYTRLTWMHLDEAEIYERLKTEDFALLALREDTLTTFTKDKILESTLGNASAKRLEQLFPTLYDLRKSLEILQITKEAWIAASSPELYNFLSDCAANSSGGAASPSNGNPGVSPPVPSGSRVRLGKVWREACTPLYHCICSICKRAAETAAPRVNHAETMATAASKQQGNTTDTALPDAWIEVLPPENYAQRHNCFGAKLVVDERDGYALEARSQGDADSRVPKRCRDVAAEDYATSAWKRARHEKNEST
ncbi:hypothetical protein B0H10DRAFT_2380371 [Mycena sp. CBHHK59/15]|nr:hypothetical protein B0H10DRAFT_2380371 [Mycena sp. CBHHK59/15]